MDATGISVRTIISIEKGHHLPSLLSAMRIANYFALSVDQLFEYKKIYSSTDKGGIDLNNSVINFQTIVVDFDGTLCYSNWPELGQPNQTLIACLQEWKRNGNKLILWTCCTGDALAKAIEWCREQNLEFDTVNDNLPEIIEYYGHNSRKISCDYYIDNRMLLSENAKA